MRTLILKTWIDEALQCYFREQELKRELQLFSVFRVILLCTVRIMYLCS